MPPLRRRESAPQVGDHIYQEMRRPHHQPTGVIVNSSQVGDDIEYVIRYYEENDYEVFDGDDLEGNWTDKFGGLYWIADTNASEYDITTFIAIKTEKLLASYKTSCGGNGRRLLLKSSHPVES